MILPFNSNLCLIYLNRSLGVLAYNVRLVNVVVVVWLVFLVHFFFCVCSLEQAAFVPAKTHAWSVNIFVPLGSSFLWLYFESFTFFYTSRWAFSIAFFFFFFLFFSFLGVLPFYMCSVCVSISPCLCRRPLCHLSVYNWTRWHWG